MYVMPEKEQLGLSLEYMRKEVMAKLKFGQAINESGDAFQPPRIVYVAAFYPNHVLCHGASGATCYTYYQLWQMLKTKNKAVNIPDRLKRR